MVRGHLVRDPGQGGARVSRVRAVAEEGLDPVPGQCRLGGLHRRVSERVVHLRVGGRGGPVRAGLLKHPSRERLHLLRDRHADAEQQGVMKREDQRAGGRAGLQRVAQLLSGLRRVVREQGGERRQRQVDMVDGNEVLVVRAGDFRVAVVVPEDQLDLAAEQAAVAVHVAGPQLIAVPGRDAIRLEGAGRRDGDADRDGVTAGGADARAGIAGTARCQPQRGGSADGGERQEAGAVAPHRVSPFVWAMPRHGRGGPPGAVPGPSVRGARMAVTGTVCPCRPGLARIAPIPGPQTACTAPRTAWVSWPSSAWG